MTLPFEFGQIVYVATVWAYKPTRVLCPVCFGKRFVTVILGDGEQQPVECEFCNVGYQGPSGTVTRHAPDSTIEERAVTGLVMDGDEWIVTLDGHAHRQSERCVFATREQAEERRAFLQAEAEINAQRNFEAQFADKKKGLTRSAGYHREQIKELRRKLEWHEAKLGRSNTKAVPA